MPASAMRYKKYRVSYMSPNGTCHTSKQHAACDK